MKTFQIQAELDHAFRAASRNHDNRRSHRAMCAEKSWAELNRAFSGVHGEPHDQMPADWIQHLQWPGLAQQHRMDGKAGTRAEFQALAGSKIDLSELTARLRANSPLLLTPLKRGTISLE
jgi:hypothetical protein